MAALNDETMHINNSLNINKIIAAVATPAEIKHANIEIQTTQHRINERPIIEPKNKSTNISRKNSTDASTMVSKWSPSDSSVSFHENFMWIPYNLNINVFFTGNC